ncbi:LAFA_0G12156g1_1 [Lachancea sp. 'fantastica']|nr:LAFA_0G12156g1_1 [Lachancea sp. 'fantastica']
MKPTAAVKHSKPNPSPHAMMYRLWAKPVGKSLSLLLASYYGLYWTWEWLEKGEKEYELRQKQSSKGP